MATSAISLSVVSASVLVQGIFFVSLAAMGDHGTYRKSIMIIMAILGAGATAMVWLFVPDASLDRPLDFNKLSAGRASEPTKWPAPYRLAPGEVPVMIEVSPGHLVCAPGLSTSLEEAA